VVSYNIPRENIERNTSCGRSCLWLIS